MKLAINTVLKIFFGFLVSLSAKAIAADTYSEAYPDDDAHNHDGSHPVGEKNCGTNYMLPYEVARMGSHSFLILGAENESHIWASHRSGTPPHTINSF